LTLVHAAVNLSRVLDAYPFVLQSSAYKERSNMIRIGRAVAVFFGVVALCSIAASGSARAASQEVKVTGCLTKKGKLKNLEFGNDSRKECGNNQTLIMFPLTTDTAETLLCRSQFAGAYLTTIKDSQGEFASRSLITMHDDGSVAISDSAEATENFGHQQGSYGCTGSDTAKALTLDFTFSNPQSIARTDWVINMTAEGTIAGQAALSVYQPLDTCNPLEEPSSCTIVPIDTFTFTSVRVEPSVP
jgi:hypothetical protein